MGRQIRRRGGAIAHAAPEPAESVMPTGRRIDDEEDSGGASARQQPGAGEGAFQASSCRVAAIGARLVDIGVDASSGR